MAIESYQQAALRCVEFLLNCKSFKLVETTVSRKNLRWLQLFTRIQWSMLRFFMISHWLGSCVASRDIRSLVPTNGGHY